MFAQLVQEARRRAGLTQAELAGRAGVPQSTIGRIETGARIPSTAMVERLVRAAGFEPVVGLEPRDPGADSLMERTLRRTPRERFDDAVRAARFVLRGREAVARASRREPVERGQRDDCTLRP